MPMLHLINGRIARAYASMVSGVDFNSTEGQEIWRDLSIELMKADFEMRESLQDPETGNSPLSLSYYQVRDYHKKVYELQNLPVNAWAAWAPLNSMEQIKGTAETGLAP